MYLDFRDAIQRLGKHVIKERYGNLFDMYERITGDDPYAEPMRIFPAIHYTMGGLWVDYNLMSTIPGCYVIGEANFSDHGANRLGASALMQGLADGYFVLPNTINDYIASNKLEKIDNTHPAVREAESQVSCLTRRLLEIKGTRSVDSFHRELGKLMWDYCGMSRTAEGLRTALAKIPELREQFWHDVKVLGDGEELNQSLEKAGRVADFFELAELICHRRARARTNPAAATSARSTRHRKARRRAMTSATRMWRRGASAASATPPSCTRSRSTSNTCTPRNGATSNANHSAHLAAAQRQRSGPHGPLRRPERQRAHVVSRDARRPE